MSFGKRKLVSANFRGDTAVSFDLLACQVSAKHLTALNMT